MIFENCTGLREFHRVARITHRQHTAVRVQEDREAQTDEVACLMQMARSDTTATAVDIERLRATRQQGLRNLWLLLTPTEQLHAAAMH